MGTPDITGLRGNPQGNKNTNNANDEKKRTHKKYIPSINRTALQELEGTTTSSFVDLAREVILINGIPYDEEDLPMSKARKMDFERLIAHHAKLEIYGSRKYHIKSVIKRVEKELDNDVELKIARKQAYTKPKTLTEAQKEARREVYKAKKEIEDRAKVRKAELEKENAKKRIAELNEQEKQAIEQEKLKAEQEREKLSNNGESE